MESPVASECRTPFRAQMVAPSAAAATLAFFTLTAQAQQPPDIVKSDATENTAMGTNALLNNVVFPPNANGDAGINNTAAGFSALEMNHSGQENVAVGAQSMQQNTDGYENTAVGTYSLLSNTTGAHNTATGTYSLWYNATGTRNSGFGDSSLESNTSGANNTAAGWGSLGANTNGSGNTALGYAALRSVNSGYNNVAIGYDAGYQVVGNNNIEISNYGTPADTGVIRIGTEGTQITTYIAGIESSKITGNAVYVTAKGQLGVLASAERYKTAIEPVGSRSDKLAQLRPVSFHLKNDPEGAVQYGLIAEEVAKIYPELVIRDEAGQTQGVRYDELAPLLLNETRQQREALALQASTLDEQRTHAAAQDAQIRAMQEQLAAVMRLNQDMQAALSQLQARDSRTAMR